MSHATNHHLLIGLTGGIGSGKSAVSALFEKLGVRIIDTDQLSRQLTQTGGAAIPAIQKAFSADFIDATGALDRSKMRAHIFTNPAYKKRLEDLLHPVILSEARRLAASSTDAPYTLIVVPLLFEGTNYRHWLDRTVTVDCEEEMQITRTMQRSQLTRQQVQAIMSQQIDRAQRLKLSDDVIENEGDWATLAEQIQRLHQQYLTISRGSD